MVYIAKRTATGYRLYNYADISKFSQLSMHLRERLEITLLILFNKLSSAY